MNRKAAISICVVFLLFIGIFFAANLILPDKEFSQRENRYLQQKPDFSLETLFSGKFTSNFEKYTTDQFAARDSWITLKAGWERLEGKDSNNGVFLCENDTLIEAFAAPDEESLSTRVGYVNALADNVDVPVYFALIPGKSELWGGLLPSGAPNDSEKAVIDFCYDSATARTVDVLSPLAEHSGEYIYYRTDHHWTSLGAYWGYAAISDAMGNSVHGVDYYTPEMVSESFYGTTYSSSGFGWTAPDSMELWVQPPEELNITNYPQGSPVEGTLYDMSKLEVKDKYAMFLGGNTPWLHIETGNEDAPSLLIVRDSYADSLVPFLLEDYSTIDVLDLRYYRLSLKEFVEQNHIDAVLVCYSVVNFCTDGNLFYLGK